MQVIVPIRLVVKNLQKSKKPRKAKKKKRKKRKLKKKSLPREQLIYWETLWRNLKELLKWTKNKKKRAFLKQNELFRKKSRKKLQTHHSQESIRLEASQLERRWVLLWTSLCLKLPNLSKTKVRLNNKWTNSSNQKIQRAEILYSLRLNLVSTKADSTIVSIPTLLSNINT